MSNYQIKSSQFYKLLFFVNGISSLIGWNTCLTSLDYFNQIYKPYNMTLWMPIPLFISNCIFGSALPFFAKYISAKNRIYICIMGLILTMLGLYIVSLKFKSNIGFWIIMFLSFLNGLFGIISQNTNFGLINYFDNKIVAIFNIGTGISGLLTNIIRIILLSIYGSNSNNQKGLFLQIAILIYFIIAIITLFFTFFINIVFFRSDFYKNYIQLKQQNTKNNLTINTLKPLLIQQQKQFIIHIKFVKTACNQFLLVIQLSSFYLIIFLNFANTFIMFPSIMLRNRKNQILNSWQIVTLITTYNIGDVIGKCLIKFRKLFNKISIMYLVIARFILIFPSIMILKNTILLDNFIFPYFNMLLMSITNGFCVGASFILIFENTSNQKIKEISGMIGGLFLQLGITTGTLLAIPINKLL